MKGIIMAGGFGTRLRPLTNSLPKPMVPLVNRPIIEHIIELLHKHSIRELRLLLYFQPEAITKRLADGKALGVNIEYFTPAADLGTAGSVAYAARKTGDRDPVLVMSGDVVTDIDLTAAMSFHKKKKAVATIVLTRVENPLAFGIVITDDNGRVTRFLEKPSWGEVFSDTINTGIYILEKEALDLAPEDKEFDFSKDLFPLLLEKGAPLYGHIAEGYWKDVGSIDEYRLANMDALHGNVKVGIPGGELSQKGVWAGAGSRIDFTSSIEGTVVIGRGCRVEANTRIANSVIGDNVVVGEGAVIIDSIIWDNVEVGRDAALQENIVGSDTRINAGALLGEGAIVSDHCSIGRNSTVKANVKVWPHKTVEDDATLASSLIWGERWNKNIFGEHGVTGLANIELSPEFAAKLGAAYGASLRKGSVVSTSRDAHKTSRMINRAVMTGILSTGVNVHDFGVTPIPVVRYLAKGGHEVGGIHTRRSPYDPRLVDLKFFDSKGLDLHPSIEKKIERLFFREDFERVGIDETGEMSFPIHGFETYQSGFMSTVDRDVIKKAGFKVVLDYSYGSPSRIFPAILGMLNCEVIALNANLDSARLTKTSDEFRKSLDQLSTIVRSLSADMGVLLDAGGEKIFLVDETGDTLDEDTSLGLITLLVLKSLRARSKKGTVAVPVTTSRAIDSMAKAYGIGVLHTNTTARGLMEAASKENVVFVGEPSGGYIFPQFQPCFDGMYAVVKILEMLASNETRLHKLLREIPPSIMVKERIPCSWESKGMIMRRLAEDSRGKETVQIDGIRINMGEEWIAAYPSQDHAWFNIVAEASTVESAKGLVERYSEKIKRWQAGL